MLDQKLIDILVCPENKEPVQLAEEKILAQINEKINKGEIADRAGNKVGETLQAALIRKDGKYVYPVRDDIPVMLIDHAIPL